MNRDKPVACLAIHRRTEDEQYKRHLQRLKNVRPSVDNKPPRKPPSHLLDRDKKKKNSQQIEREFEIAFENTLLLQKLKNIMQCDSNRFNSSPPILPRSLNSRHRRQELERIMHENMGIVSRIQSVTSSYETKKWDMEHKETRRLLKRISKPPRYAISPSQPLPQTSSVASLASLSPKPLPPLSPSSKSPSSKPESSTMQPQKPKVRSAPREATASSISSPSREHFSQPPVGSSSLKPMRIAPSPKVANPLMRLPSSERMDATLTVADNASPRMVDTDANVSTIVD